MMTFYLLYLYSIDILSLISYKSPQEIFGMTYQLQNPFEYESFLCISSRDCYFSCIDVSRRKRKQSFKL